MSFASLGLSDALLRALSAQNYKKPYPVQVKAIPAILKRKDVLGIAKTGSGKTASYALPILQHLGKKDLGKSRNVNTLVLVPTRELAIQVQEVFYDFSKHLPQNVKSLAVYGGVSINPQMKALYGVNVLVATPGRLLELVENNAVQLSQVDMLVLDEADKMLDLGFKDEMDKILSKLPKKRQNMLFSATLSNEVAEINQMVLVDPFVVQIEEEEADIEQINQSAYFVIEERRGPILRYLIKEKDMQKVLIFTSSSYKADNVVKKLKANGIEARAVHGKKTQGSRKEALLNFKQGKFRVLVATDLLARGIDIEKLPYVINYELPRSPKDYIHRIGRTGRADENGEAISIITPETEHHFKVIQKKMKKRVELIDCQDYDLTGY